MIRISLLRIFAARFSSSDLASEFPPGSGLFVQRDRIYTRDVKTDNYFAPKGILEWTPTEGLLTYFSISKGVKTWRHQHDRIGQLDGPGCRTATWMN